MCGCGGGVCGGYMCFYIYVWWACGDGCGGGGVCVCVCEGYKGKGW